MSNSILSYYTFFTNLLAEPDKICFLLQTGGVFNTCFCPSLLFGSRYYYSSGSWGGYVQFGNRTFYENAYHLEYTWYPASALGLVVCIIFLVWAIAAWLTARTLWDEMYYEREHIDVDPDWNIPLDWLT